MQRRPRVGRLQVEIIAGQTLELFHLDSPESTEPARIEGGFGGCVFPASVLLIDGVEWMVPDDMPSHGIPVTGYPVTAEDGAEARRVTCVGLDLRQAEEEDNSIRVIWLEREHEEGSPDA